MFWACDVAHHVARPLPPIVDSAGEGREPTECSSIGGKFHVSYDAAKVGIHGATSKILVVGKIL